MSDFTEKLKSFLHDPIDKCFDIPTHIERAKNYAQKLGVSGVEEADGPDRIASCMERSLLPKKKVIKDFNEVRHPFGKESLKIENYNKENICKAIEKVYKKLALTYQIWMIRKNFSISGGIFRIEYFKI